MTGASHEPTGLAIGRERRLAAVASVNHMPCIVWDLRSPLLKKEEKGSARLADFEFRHRARTFRLLARLIGEPEQDAVALITRGPDEQVLTEVAHRHPELKATLADLYVHERGNPAPYRLL